MLKVAKARVYLHKLACAAKVVRHSRVMEKVAKSPSTDVTKPVGTGAPSLSGGVGKGITSNNTNVGVGNDVTNPVGTNTPYKVSRTGLLANGTTTALPKPDANGKVNKRFRKGVDISPTPRNYKAEEDWWYKERDNQIAQTGNSVADPTGQWGQYFTDWGNNFAPSQQRAEWWNNNTWTPTYDSSGNQVTGSKARSNSQAMDIANAANSGMSTGMDPTQQNANEPAGSQSYNQNVPTESTLGNSEGFGRWRGGYAGSYSTPNPSNVPASTNPLSMDSYLRNIGMDTSGIRFQGMNLQDFGVEVGHKSPDDRRAAYATPGKNTITMLMKPGDANFNEWLPSLLNHESRHIMANDLDFMQLQPYPHTPSSGSGVYSGTSNNYGAVDGLKYGERYEGSEPTYPIGGSHLLRELLPVLGQVDTYIKNPSSGYADGYSDEIYMDPSKFSRDQGERKFSNPLGYTEVPTIPHPGSTRASSGAKTVKSPSGFLERIVSGEDFIPRNTNGSNMFTPGTPARTYVDRFGNNSEGNRFGMWGGPTANWNNGNLSYTFNPLIENMAGNVGQTTDAYREARSNRGQYYAMREAVQGLMDPLYAESKPVGNKDAYRSYGETVQSPYTVREILTMATSGDPAKYEEAKKYSYLLRSDLRYLFDTNDAKSMAENVGNFPNVMNILNSDKSMITPEMEGLQTKYSVTPGFDKETDFRNMETMGDMGADVQRGYSMQHNLKQFMDGSTDFGNTDTEYMPAHYEGDGSERPEIRYWTEEDQKRYEIEKAERENRWLEQEEERRLEEENRRAEEHDSGEFSFTGNTSSITDDRDSLGGYFSNVLTDVDKSLPDSIVSSNTSKSLGESDTPNIKRKQDMPDFLKGYNESSQEVPSDSVPEVPGYDTTTDGQKSVYDSGEGSVGEFGNDPYSGEGSVGGYESVGEPDISNLHGGIGQQPYGDSEGRDLLGGIGKEPVSDIYSDFGLDPTVRYDGALTPPMKSNSDSNEKNPVSDYDPYENIGPTGIDDAKSYGYTDNGIDYDRYRNVEDQELSPEEIMRIGGQYANDDMDAQNQIERYDMYRVDDSQEPSFDDMMNLESEAISNGTYEPYMHIPESPRNAPSTKEVMRGNSEVSEQSSEFPEGHILNTMNSKERASYERLIKSYRKAKATEIMSRRLKMRQDADMIKNSPNANHEYKRDSDGNVISETHTGTISMGKVVPDTNVSSRNTKGVGSPDTSKNSKPTNGKSNAKTRNIQSGLTQEQIASGRTLTDKQIQSIGTPEQQFEQLSGADLVAALDMNRATGYWTGFQNMGVPDIINGYDSMLEGARRNGKLSSEDVKLLHDRLVNFLRTEVGRGSEVTDYFRQMRKNRRR